MLNSANLPTVAQFVTDAYNTGLLQNGAPLVVCGVTATLAIRGRHNELTINYGSITRSIVLWDSESGDVQDAAIIETVRAVYTAVAK